MWKALFLMMMMLPSAVLADCVVLLHGLARTEGSLALTEDTLRRRGYEVVNRGYPPTRETLPDLIAAEVAPAVATCGSWVWATACPMGRPLPRSMPRASS